MTASSFCGKRPSKCRFGNSPFVCSLALLFAHAVLGMAGGSLLWGETDTVVAQEIRLEYRAAGEQAPAADPSEEITASQREPVDSEERLLIVGLPGDTLRGITNASWGLEQWQRVWRVQLEGADSSLPSLLGRYEIEPGGLSFVPRFPLRSGKQYRVTLELDRLPALSSQDFSSGDSSWVKVITTPNAETASSEPAEPPRLVAIYPSGSVLPENQLKFYLHFSTPMRRGIAYDQVRLWVESPSSESDESKWERIEYPFLELPEELWDPNYQRFTLFFDPGRIKRGLKPREEFGPALEEGRRYRFEVDRQWRSATGEPLIETVYKEFQVGPPDDRQPNVRDWRMTVPAGKSDWLRLEFEEPLDHGMLQRVLTVQGPSGDRLAGEVAIDQQETRWNFRPRDPWQPGEYQIVIGTHLEDRAGNSLAKPFEVDLFDSVESRVETTTVQLPFRVELPAN